MRFGFVNVKTLKLNVHQIRSSILNIKQLVWTKSVTNKPRFSIFFLIIIRNCFLAREKRIEWCFREPYDRNPMLISALSAVKSKRMPMDLVRVETRNQILFSFLSVGWGLIADIDIESERLRAIGGQRFTVWSVARLIGLRTYKGKISYLTCNKVPSTENIQNGKICRKECTTEGTLSHSRSYGDELNRYEYYLVSKFIANGA